MTISRCLLQALRGSWTGVISWDMNLHSYGMSASEMTGLLTYTTMLVSRASPVIVHKNPTQSALNNFLLQKPLWQWEFSVFLSVNHFWFAHSSFSMFLIFLGRGHKIRWLEPQTPATARQDLYPFLRWDVDVIDKLKSSAWNSGFLIISLLI